MAMEIIYPLISISLNVINVSLYPSPYPLCLELTTPNANWTYIAYNFPE